MALCDTRNKIYDQIQTKKAEKTLLFSERIVSFAFIGIFSAKVISNLEVTLYVRAMKWPPKALHEKSYLGTRVT
jgi:hypothetical protein